MPTNLTKRRIFELDYIRAISALLIMLFHYTTQYDTSLGHLESWPIAFPWGSRAVSTFFLLTGYLTVCHYSGSVLQFYYKRWIRIWPTYAVCIVITSVFMAILMPERLRTVPEILLNLTTFHAYLGARAVDGVYWTLTIEVIFYFWIAFCMMPKKTERQLALLYAWSLLAAVVNLCNALGFCPLPVTLSKIAFITEHVPCFIAGVAISLQNSKNAVSFRQLLPIYLFCLIALCAGNTVGSILWTVLWALLIWAVTAGKLRFALKESNFLHKCLLFLAGISYPLYLLHQFIGFAIIRKLEQLGCLSQLWIFVPIAFSLLLATATHYWIELPIGKLLTKHTAKK